MSRPLGNLPETVLDPGPVGINHGSGHYERALATPELDIRGEQQRGSGLADLGRGIASAGGAMAALAIKQMEAISIRQEADAQNVMLEAEQRIAEKIAAEPDETKWEQIARQHVKETQGKLAATKMSQSARGALEPQMRRWELHRLGDVKISSARESIGKAKKVMFDKLELAKQTGDVALRDSTLAGMEAGGYISKERGQLAVMEHDQFQEKKQKQERTDAAMKTAIADPEAWLATNTKPAEGQDAAEYLQIRSVAEGASRDLFNSTQKDMADFAAQNPLATPQQMQEHAGMRLRPGELQKWKDFALTNLNDAERQRRSTPEYIRETFGSLLDAADELSKSTVDMHSDEARDKYLQIHIMAQTLPEGLRGEVTQKIEKKWRQGPPEIDTTVKGYINQSVEDMFNQNAFGNLTTKVPKVEGDEGFDKGRVTYKTVVDPVGRSEAQKRRADMTIALNDWMKQNPNATREQATAAITGMAAQSMTKEDLNGLLKGANAKTTAPAAAPTGAVNWSNLLPGNVRAKVTSYGYANDSTPDGNSSAGIGAFTTQADALAGPDAPTRLKNGDFAVSSDVEQMLVNANIRPTDKVKIILSDGSEHTGRWMDRTANDEELKAINAKRKAAGQSEIKPLRGRIDIFNPAGKHPKDDVSVVSVSRI